MLPKTRQTSQYPPARRGMSLNIFLYHVTQNLGYRNLDQPARNFDGALVNRPRLGLNLQYMITALAPEDVLKAQEILAVAMQIIHENPTLTRKMIKETISSSTGDLANSDLADQVELVKITPLSLSLEEITKLWSSFFQTNYRISAMYEATVILLDSVMESKPSLPVITPKITITTMTFRQPVLEQVQPQVLVYSDRTNDPVGGGLAFSIVGDPNNTAHGTLSGITGTPPNQVTYTPASTPAPGWTGIDSFQYEVTDSHGTASDPVTVSISVDKPTAIPRSVQTHRNTQVTITLEGTDPVGGGLAFSIVGDPNNTAHGTLSGITGTPPNQVTYTPASTPAPGWTGIDSFQYEVTDSHGTASDPVTVSISVDKPTAIPRSVQTHRNTQVTITLEGTDPVGGGLAFSIVGDPNNTAHGTLSGITGTPPNQVTYTPASTPAPGWTGIDSFQYEVTDSHGTASDPVTVSISVDKPTAIPRSVQTHRNTQVTITLEGTDPVGGGLAFSIVGDPNNTAHGTLSGITGTPPNQVTYTPASTPAPGWTGIDSFQYEVTDSHGTASDPVTVSISVDKPTAIPWSVQTHRNTQVTINLEGDRERLTLIGQNLQADDVADKLVLKLGDASIELTQSNSIISDTRQIIMLPEGLTVGIKSLLIQKPGLKSPTGHTMRQEFESNVLAFVLAPKIVTQQQPMPITRGDSLMLDLGPAKVAWKQKVSFLIGPEVGVPSGSFLIEIPVPTRDPTSNPVSQLPVNIPRTLPDDVVGRTFLLRIRVDGADSPLIVDNTIGSRTYGQFILPAVTVTT